MISYCQLGCFISARGGSGIVVAKLPSGGKFGFKIRIIHFCVVACTNSYQPSSVLQSLDKRRIFGYSFFTFFIRLQGLQNTVAAHYSYRSKISNIARNSQ